MKNEQHIFCSLYLRRILWSEERWLWINRYNKSWTEMDEKCNYFPSLDVLSTSLGDALFLQLASGCRVNVIQQLYSPWSLSQCMAGQSPPVWFPGFPALTRSPRPHCRTSKWQAGGGRGTSIPQSLLPSSELEATMIFSLPVSELSSSAQLHALENRKEIVSIKSICLLPHSITLGFLNTLW